MRRIAFAITTLTLLVAAPAAHAQFVAVVIGGGAAPISELQTNVRVSGAVSVDFRRGGESGTVTWNPSGRAQLLSFGFREHGRRYEGGFLSFGDGDPNDAPTTSARVRREDARGAAAGLCADAGNSAFQTVESPQRAGRSVELGLISSSSASFAGDSFRTRCAGPLGTDIEPSLPRRVVTEKALRRGGLRVDLSGDQPLSAPGLTGTVHSTVVLHLGRTHDLLAGDDSGGPPFTHTLRRRAIDVSYRIDGVSGQVVTDLHGLDDPDLCGPLDACGLMGSVTTAPRVRSGRIVVSAIAPLSRSRVDLRRAVGLAPGRPPRGVDAYASGFWSHDRGSVTSALQRDGGAAGGCLDSVTIANGGALSLDIAGERVTAGYGNPLYAASDDLRTRCAGPTLADAAGSGSLAATTFPLTWFARRRLTLHLTSGRAYSADGYAGRTRPDITVVMRRIRVREYVQRIPVPAGFFKLRLP